MMKVYSMTAIMDLSFPGQRTATATSGFPHDSVYVVVQIFPWLKIFQTSLSFVFLCLGLW